MKLDIEMVWCAAGLKRVLCPPVLLAYGSLGHWATRGLWVREVESDTRLVWKDIRVERDSLGKLSGMKL